MEDDLECHGACHSAKKNATHNPLTTPKRGEESNKSPREKDRKMLEDAAISMKLGPHSQTKSSSKKVRK